MFNATVYLRSAANAKQSIMLDSKEFPTRAEAQQWAERQMRLRNAGLGSSNFFAVVDELADHPEPMQNPHLRPLYASDHPPACFVQASEDAFKPAQTTYILVVGNIMEGFDFVGPFDTYEAAQTHGERNSQIEWHVAECNSPEPVTPTLIVDNTKDI